MEKAAEHPAKPGGGIEKAASAPAPKAA